MSKRKRKARKGSAVLSIEDIFSELGIASADWTVDVDFSKGVLSGDRGVTVVVENLKTGCRKKLISRCGTKKECYSIRNALIQDAIQQLR